MLLPLLGFVLLIGLIAFFVLYRTYQIPSSSMEPTLLVGDHVLVRMWRFGIPNPQRGDIVVFEPPDDPGIHRINRVVGLPGDRIEIVDKQLRLNGQTVVEPYVEHRGSLGFPPRLPQRDDFGPYVVPADHFFMMGDNRDNSYDSRFYGVVPRKLLRGGSIQVYGSWDPERQSPRWDRIGKRLR